EGAQVGRGPRELGCQRRPPQGGSGHRLGVRLALPRLPLVPRALPHRQGRVAREALVFLRLAAADEDAPARGEEAEVAAVGAEAGVGREAGEAAQAIFARSGGSLRFLAHGTASTSIGASPFSRRSRAAEGPTSASRSPAWRTVSPAGMTCSSSP